MVGTKLCERCIKAGRQREAVRGERFCRYCRFIVLKLAAEKYIDHGCRKETEKYDQRIEPFETPENTLDQIRSAKSRFADDTAKVKSIIWQNSITRKFEGKNIAEQAKKARKYTKHERFIKLCNGFDIRPIHSHKRYRETLVRALNVDAKSRASNFAYVQLLDYELAKYEKKHPLDCWAIYKAVCNEMEKLSNKHKDV